MKDTLPPSPRDALAGLLSSPQPTTCARVQSEEASAVRRDCREIDLRMSMSVKDIKKILEVCCPSAHGHALLPRSRFDVTERDRRAVTQACNTPSSPRDGPSAAVLQQYPGPNMPCWHRTARECRVCKMASAQAAGVDYSDCYEKSELVNRLAELRAGKAKTRPQPRHSPGGGGGGGGGAGGPPARPQKSSTAAKDLGKKSNGSDGGALPPALNRH